MCIHPKEGRIKMNIFGFYKKTALFTLILLLLGISLIHEVYASSGLWENLPGPGAVLPAFTVAAPVQPAYRSYLNLDKETTIKPGEMNVDLWLIEVFNVYCAACNRMAPYMSELHAKIEKDPELKGKVKMIGIGAGNDIWDIDEYTDRYSYPIVPDEDYVFHNLVGQPPTPFLLFAKPYGQGRLLVVDSHLGVIEDSDKLLSLVKKAFKTEVSEIAPSEAKELKKAGGELVMPIPEDELMEKVRQSLTSTEEIENDIKKISLPGLGTVYMGFTKKSKKPIFARVVARKIPCEDCHDVFYIYSFDHKGRFLRFIPIAIFKYGNEEWDEEDIAKIQNRFEGKSLLKEIPFNTKLDAVSSATISSELIFDSIGKTKQVIDKLIELGHIRKSE
jgi:hypothetical protein